MLGTLGANLLGNIVAGKGMNKAGEGFIRAGYGSSIKTSYGYSFGVEHIPKEIKIFIDKFMVVANIFRIQAYDLVICGYFCIGFIDFMLKDKTLTDSTNFFSPNNFDKNDDIILKYFMTNV